jgi:hypothetical protein
MKSKVSSVIWFAVASTAIAYGMREGYRHFSTLDEPARILGYLAVGITTGCSVVGMISVARASGWIAAKRAPASGRSSMKPA